MKRFHMNHSNNIPIEYTFSYSGATAANNGLPYLWHEIDKGKMTYFSVLNVFTTPDTIEFRQEYSQDRVRLTRMATGHDQPLRAVSSSAPAQAETACPSNNLPMRSD
ncbi:MAG: hypothetical protein ABI076_12605 [Acidobacteriaceae bacterium]